VRITDVKLPSGPTRDAGAHARPRLALRVRDLRYVDDVEASKGSPARGRHRHRGQRDVRGRPDLAPPEERDRNRRNTVIVGYQAQHTLGRRLVESVRGEIVASSRARADVVMLNGFSARRSEDLIDYRQLKERTAQPGSASTATWPQKTLPGLMGQGHKDCNACGRGPAGDRLETGCRGRVLVPPLCRIRFGEVRHDYDAIGQYRTTDNGEPVDASGDAPVGEGEISFTNAIELVGQIAESPVAQRCYLTQWFRC
jgi:hypothetical protein